jgi:hypothetical protein
VEETRQDRENFEEWKTRGIGGVERGRAYEGE